MQNIIMKIKTKENGGWIWKSSEQIKKKKIEKQKK